jgi:hypothetical protein
MSKTPNRKTGEKRIGTPPLARANRVPRRQPARPTPATPPAPVKPGRPSKCTPELTDLLVAHIRAGSYTAQAARACGVHHAQISRWLSRGEDEADRLDRLCAAAGDDEAAIDAIEPLPGEVSFLSFASAIKRAEAEAESRYVGIIFQASSVKAEFKGQWTAAAWWLERHHPERWGRKERIEATQTIDFGARIANIEVVRTSTPGASAEVFDVNGEAESRYAHLVTSTNAEVDELMS